MKNTTTVNIYKNTTLVKSYELEKISRHFISTCIVNRFLHKVANRVDFVNNNDGVVVSYKEAKLWSQYQKGTPVENTIWREADCRF